MEENKSISIEDNFKKLEETVAALEGEDVSLEKAFSLYEEGIKLVQACEKEIDMVEKKVLCLFEGEAHEFS